MPRIAHDPTTRYCKAEGKVPSYSKESHPSQIIWISSSRSLIHSVRLVVTTGVRFLRGAVIFAGGPMVRSSRTRKSIPLSTSNVGCFWWLNMWRIFCSCHRSSTSWGQMEGGGGYYMWRKKCAIHLAHDPTGSATSKHVDLRDHFIRDVVEENNVRIIHVDSKQQHADDLMNHLPPESFRGRHRYQVSLMNEHRQLGSGTWHELGGHIGNKKAPELALSYISVPNIH